MKYEYCNDCPNCDYRMWQEPGDFIYQSNRYCRLVKEDREDFEKHECTANDNTDLKLLDFWCTTGDRTIPPDWCPLKDK